MKLDNLKSATVFSGVDATAKAIEAMAKRNGVAVAAVVKDGFDPKRKTKAGFPIFIRGSKASTILDAAGDVASSEAKAALPDDEALAALAASRGLKFEDGARDRVVQYWASDERVDGHGDIVEQDWSFDEYAKNPVLLAQHEWNGDPIGAALDWKVKHRAESDYTGPALWMLHLFASADASARADSVLRLVKAGIMRSCSVGFWSERVVDVQDPDERLALGLGQWGWILQGNHLMELSPVSLPANPGAHAIAELAKAVESGAIKAVDVALLRELAGFQMRSSAKAARRETDLAWAGVERLLFPKSATANGIDSDPSANDPAADPAPAWGDEVASLRAEIAQLRGEIADARAAIVGEIQSVRAIADDVRNACDRMVRAAGAGDADGTEKREGAGDAGDDNGNGAEVDRDNASPGQPKGDELLRTLAKWPRSKLRT